MRVKCWEHALEHKLAQEVEAQPHSVIASKLHGQFQMLIQMEAVVHQTGAILVSRESKQ